MSEMSTTSEFAARLAVAAEQQPEPPAARAGDLPDSRPDLVPRPAHRTLYVAAEDHGEG